MFCEVEAIFNNITRRIKRTLCYEENEQHVGYVNLKANEMKVSMISVITRKRLTSNKTYLKIFFKISSLKMCIRYVLHSKESQRLKVYH